jgi:hypothetical protein
MVLSKEDETLLETLRMVQKHPAIMLGGASFERLHGFIEGVIHGLSWPAMGNSPMIDLFQTWLGTRNGLGDWAAWHRIIRLLSSDDRNGFDTFFRQLDAFLEDSRES